MKHRIQCCFFILLLVLVITCFVFFLFSFYKVYTKIFDLVANSKMFSKIYYKREENNSIFNFFKVFKVFRVKLKKSLINLA